MPIPPAVPPFGDLRITDVFEHFDGPRLFACTNNAGTSFLAVWVDEDHGQDSWVYVPVSSYRLMELADGRMPLRTAFTKPEDGFVFLVRIGSDPVDVSVEPRGAGDLEDGYLPHPEAFIRARAENVRRDTAPDIPARALQSNRETVALRIVSKDRRRITGPARLVGEILSSFQSTLDAIGQALAGQATSRGQVPDYLRSRTQMSVVSHFAGSFGVELAADELPDLFGNSLARDVLNAFSSLMEAGNDRAKLRQELMSLKVRSALRYRGFLNAIASGDGALDFEWASPSRISRRVSITAGQAGVAARVISEFESVPPDELRFEGILTMGDVMSQRFTLVSQMDGRRVTGRVAGTASEALSGATLNDLYSALVREIRASNAATDDESVRYELVELTRLGNEIEEQTRLG